MSTSILHRLISIVGMDATEAILKELGGSTIHLPSIFGYRIKGQLERLRQNILDAFDGSNYAEVARQFNVSERAIRRVMDDTPSDELLRNFAQQSETYMLKGKLRQRPIYAVRRAPAMTNESNWASVLTPDYVYVGIVKREEFDRLALPATDHGVSNPDRLVLTKTARDPSGCTIVFQHWYGPTPAQRAAEAAAAQALARITAAGVTA